MKREKSIASFIEKLPMDGSVGNCDFTMLVTDMAFLGGDDDGSTNKKCTNNSTFACYSSTNSDVCINSNDACGKSLNGGRCTSSGKVDPPIGGTNPHCGNC